MRTDEMPGPLKRVAVAITPHPHRGDLIAAGAVVFAAAIAMLDVRMDGTWDAGVLFVFNGLAAALVLGMGLLAPSEGGAPRPYQSALLVAGLLLLGLALGRLAITLGADSTTSPGALTWIAATLALAAAACARKRHSAACTLIAAIAGAIALLALVQWVFDPKGVSTFRWILLAVIVLQSVAALQLRERARRHAVVLVDAAGLALIALGLTWFTGVALSGIFGSGSGSPGFGWAIVLLVGAFGLIAYAGVDREPGPGYVGLGALIIAVLTIGAPDPEGASLVGWPLLLLAIGIAGVVFGLRPRRPLPPPPPAARADEPPPDEPSTVVQPIVVPPSPVPPSPPPPSPASPSPPPPNPVPPIGGGSSTSLFDEDDAADDPDAPFPPSSPDRS